MRFGRLATGLVTIGAILAAWGFVSRPTTACVDVVAGGIPCPEALMPPVSIVGILIALMSIPVAWATPREVQLRTRERQTVIVAAIVLWIGLMVAGHDLKIVATNGGHWPNSCGVEMTAGDSCATPWTPERLLLGLTALVVTTTAVWGKRMARVVSAAFAVGATAYWLAMMPVATNMFVGVVFVLCSLVAVALAPRNQLEDSQRGSS